MPKPSDAEFAQQVARAYASTQVQQGGDAVPFYVNALATGAQLRPEHHTCPDCGETMEHVQALLALARRMALSESS